MGLRLSCAFLAVTAVLVPLSGCDPQAHPASGVAHADMGGGAGGGASGYRESCATSRDCASGLRCLDGVCAGGQASRIGDYYWASGMAAAAKGNYAQAAQALAQAMEKYPADQVPAGLICAQGAALRRQADARTAEQAARLLHRCLLATAPGSDNYRLAMGELVELEPLGLDPAVLERDKLAETYLVRPALKPASDELTVGVTTAKPATNRLAQAWLTLIQGEDGKKALAKCYEDFWNATRKPAAALPLTFKYKAKFDEEEEVYQGGALEIVPAVVPSGPEGNATQCAASALSAVAMEFTRKGTGGSWQVDATLTLGGAEASAPP